MGRSSDGVDSSCWGPPAWTGIAGGFGCGASGRASFPAWIWLTSALINVNTAHLKNAGTFERGRQVLLPEKDTVKCNSFFAWKIQSLTRLFLLTHLWSQANVFHISIKTFNWKCYDASSCPLLMWLSPSTMPRDFWHGVLINSKSNVWLKKTYNHRTVEVEDKNFLLIAYHFDGSMTGKHGRVAWIASRYKAGIYYFCVKHSQTMNHLRFPLITGTWVHALCYLAVWDLTKQQQGQGKQS